MIVMLPLRPDLYIYYFLLVMSLVMCSCIRDSCGNLLLEEAPAENQASQVKDYLGT